MKHIAGVNREQDPLKQGLKVINSLPYTNNFFIRGQDPLEQGVKASSVAEY